MPSNLLSADTATIEGGIGTWTSAGGTTSVAQSTEQAAEGSNSLKVVSSGSGAMFLRPNGSLLPASAGVEYTLFAWVRGATDSRNCQWSLFWHDGSGTQIGSTVTGTTVADTTSGWTQVSVTATAPTGTAYWSSYLMISGAATSEAHYIDKASFHQGSSLVFSYDLSGTTGGVSGVASPTLLGGPLYFRGSTQNLTSQPTTNVSLTYNIPVDSYAVARVAVDNSGASGAAPGLTVSDFRSNTWTVLGPANVDPGAANAGATAYIAYARITTELQVGDTITFSWTSGSPAAKAIVVEELKLNRVTPVAVAALAATGTSGTPSVSRTPSASGQIVYTVLASEGPSGDAYTEDSDTTNGTWASLTRLATTDATATNNQRVAGAIKTVSASGAQTWNPTITSRDWAALAVVFSPDAPIAHAVSGVSAGVSGVPAPVLARATSFSPNVPNGVSGVPSPVLGMAVPLSGTTGGTSTVESPALVNVKTLAGVAAGTATATGTLRNVVGLSGTSAALAQLAGGFVGSWALVGRSDAVATTAAAAIGITRGVAGTSAGVSSLTGPLGMTHQLSGLGHGVSTATGTLAVAPSLEGISEGTSSLSGDLSVGNVFTVHDLAGTTGGVSGAAGETPFLTVPLEGTVNATSLMAGGLIGSWGLIGRTDGVGGASAEVPQSIYGLAGLVGGVSLADGTLTVVHLATPIEGVTSGVGSGTGTLSVVYALEGETGGGEGIAEGVVFTGKRLIYRTRTLEHVL